MPLVESGNALFAGSADEFMEMAPASTLTSHITREFNRRWGTVSDSEIKSWRNSLTALAAVLADTDVVECGVGVELRLPSTSKRIDASFVAGDGQGQPQVVLVELKQWEFAAPSQFPDNVVVGNRETLHPSVQAAAYSAYLREAHSAFTEHGFGLTACAFLHNMSVQSSQSLRGLRYGGALADAPMFTKGEEAALAGLLANRLRGGDGMTLLPTLVSGYYRPSTRLIEGIAQALRTSPGWILLDEQRLAFNIVRGLVERASSSRGKQVVIVSGGPGTGKSVVAAHLLVALAADGSRKVAHATGSKAFTTNLRAISPRGGSAVFQYFNNFREQQTAPNSYDVIICDEAHRLRESSNDRFTPRALKSTISQAREIVRAARVTVFFLDQRQNVRPGETGTVQEIRRAAGAEQAEVHELELSGQFRCSGSAGYIDWVDKLFSATPELPQDWADGEYEFRVFTEPKSLERAIEARASAGSTARIVAGFCWPWSDPAEDGTLVPDVVIGDWKRPWNEKSPEQQRPPRPQPPPSRHPVPLYLTGVVLAYLIPIIQNRRKLAKALPSQGTTPEAPASFGGS